MDIETSSSCKKYNNEKAIISLTSWKKRINTVGKTIYSLLKQCPGFHIVLVLSEEEFPKKEKELPKDLMLMANANIFEILWVYKNYKSFKKVFFTMNKYKTVPIISADDGCMYTCNYAEELYNEWTNHKNCIVSWKKFQGDLSRKNPCPCGGGGYGIIYPPNCFKNFAIYCLNKNFNEIIKNPNDDRFTGILAFKLNINFYWLKRSYSSFIDIDANGLTANRNYKIGTNWIFEEIIDKTIKEIK